MEEVQRTRILEAMAEMTVEWGAGAVTVSHVVARAGVSRRTFYELFGDREACLLAAFDLGVERARARIEPAYAAQPRWRDGIRVGLAAFLSFLEDEPALGRLCVVHSLGGGAEVLSRRAEMLGRLAKVVDRGRTEGAAGSVQPSEVIAEGIVGAVLSVIYTRLQGAEAGREEAAFERAVRGADEPDPASLPGAQRGAAGADEARAEGPGGPGRGARR